MKAEKEYPQRADYYQYSFREPFYTDQALETDWGFTDYPIKVQGLIGLKDKKEYEWTFIQRKKATPPFILEEEEGESPGWNKFIVDKDLAPKPEFIEDNFCIMPGKVKISWQSIPSAEGYAYTVKNAFTSAVVSEGQTFGTFIEVDVSEFNTSYIFEVAAGIQMDNSEWIYGPKSEGDFATFPSKPTNLSPTNDAVVGLGSNNSVVLKWTEPPGANLYALIARVKGEQTPILEEFVSGNSFKLENLDFNQEIVWTLRVISTSGCEGEEVQASFKVASKPFIPSLGINLVVKDGQNAFHGSFSYKVVITHPNGQVLVKETLVSGSIGLLFDPLFGNINITTDGSLVPMHGNYNVHIEIKEVLHEGKLTDGLPTWEFFVESYNIANSIKPGGGIDASKKPELVSQMNFSGAFGALSAGFSIDRSFGYNLKDLEK